MNIVFHYLYRDGANYKNLNSIILDNSSHIDLDELTNLLKAKLIDGAYFNANQWRLPDLHFGTWDDEIDHDWHEFESVEHTDEAPTGPLTIIELITAIKNTTGLQP